MPSSFATWNMVIKLYDCMGAILVRHLAYISIYGRHSWYIVITRISSLQLYLHDIFSHNFNLVTISKFKHLLNIFLEMCDEIITVHLSLFLKTLPYTIEQTRYCQQLHCFTQRYRIQKINVRDVLHNNFSQFYQLNSNSQGHWTKRVIWRCE